VHQGRRDLGGKRDASSLLRMPGWGVKSSNEKGKLFDFELPCEP
jgi:hypothetical protein